ncbi:hypothetical protein ACHAXM_010093 [Skeletonema potamos]
MSIIIVHMERNGHGMEDILPKIILDLVGVDKMSIVCVHQVWRLTLSCIKNEQQQQPQQKVLMMRRRMYMMSDTNQLATIGGFVDTGETTEHAVLREVQEETGITIPAYLMSSHNSGGGSSSSKSNNSLSPLKLIGVYSDPRRDNRRHIVSIAYALEFMPDIMTTKDGSGIPKAGDDAKEVIAIPLEEIGVKYVGEDWYADHLSILLDWKMQLLLRDEKVDRSKELYGGDVARSTCS